MTKTALIENIAKNGNMSHRDAKRTIDLVFAGIATGMNTLKKQQHYNIRNFGTFTIIKRPAHKGRNPKTGETIHIKAKNHLKFRPGKSLKKAARTS